MPGEAAKGPPPDCRPIVLCLRSGIKRGCDRRMSTGQGAQSTYTSRRLDTYLWRRDRQQSVRWGRAAADKTRGYGWKVPDRPGNAGYFWSLPDSPIDRLTCVQGGRPAAQTDL